MRRATCQTARTTCRGEPAKSGANAREPQNRKEREAGTERTGYLQRWAAENQEMSLHALVRHARQQPRRAICTPYGGMPTTQRVKGWHMRCNLCRRLRAPPERLSQRRGSHTQYGRMRARDVAVRNSANKIRVAAAEKNQCGGNAALLYNSPQRQRVIHRKEEKVQREGENQHMFRERHV